MKNITVTVSDELYRHARMWAARENTTVTSLVRQFLELLAELPLQSQFCQGYARSVSPKSTPLPPGGRFSFSSRYKL